MAHQEISQVGMGASVPLSIGRSTRGVSKEVSSESKTVSEMKVGEKIREVRKSKRIRQKVLARMVGISPGALTNFEKGRRRISLDWLQRIAEALDTPMAYFLPDEKEQNRATPGDPRERRLLAAWRELAKNEALKSDFLRLLEHLGQTKGIRKVKKRAS
jgi:transcriptional regulator with XRE-family HTH domain